MSDLHPTPLGATEAARLKIKAREDAIRANGIKQGRVMERQEICHELGAATVEDLRVLNRIISELNQAHEREETKHVRAGFWRGAAIFGMAGVLGGLGCGIVASNLSQSSAFDSAAEYGARQVVTGAALGRAQQETDPARQQEALEPQP